MSSEIIVAIIAFLGTLAGTFGGILASSKLTNFRLQKLEEKVDKHNSVISKGNKRPCIKMNPREAFPGAFIMGVQDGERSNSGKGKRA